METIVSNASSDGRNLKETIQRGYVSCNQRVFFFVTNVIILKSFNL